MNDEINESAVDTVESSNNTVTASSPRQEQKGFSITSMVLGIVSFAFLWNFLIGIACAVLAIIFGVKGLKLDGKGMAKAGYIMGIVSLGVYGLILLFSLVLSVSFLSALL